MENPKTHQLLVEQLRRVHRHCAALGVATAASDQLAASIAAMRARTASQQLSRSVAEHVDLDPVLLSSIRQTLADNERILGVAHVPSRTEEYQRVVRWMATRGRAIGVDRDDPDLFEVEAVDKHLGLLSFARLYVARCRFVAVALRGSNFDDSVFEDCDLSMSHVERTSWQRARLVRCRLSGAFLVDAVLDGATFEDCDLRGADLAQNLGRRVTARKTQFVRCDLRETGWEQRGLAGTRFDRCRFHGVHGRPLLESIEIEKPDLSPAGDGSQIGMARDVLSTWCVAGFVGKRGSG